MKAAVVAPKIAVVVTEATVGVVSVASVAIFLLADPVASPDKS
jgi:hypothetical protein